MRIDSMEYYEFFSADYAQARERFCSRSADAGAQLSSYTLAEHLGPDDERLSIDVAHFGDVEAENQLVVVSGTHGIEGFTGSAIQLRWIAEVAARPPSEDAGVVLIHSLNPWGFAYRSRTNENNVDLNRNFIVDYSGTSNAIYRELHDALAADDWTLESRRATQRRIEEVVEMYGDDRVFDSISKGQYQEPDGLNYGGAAREWSNIALERIVRERLACAQRVGFIDWHTGIGEYARPFFLCFHDKDGPMFERAADWWGRDVLEDARPHGKRRPDYQGLVFHGMERFLDGRPLCGAVVEFGTRGWHMKEMLRLDLWLRSRGDRQTGAFRQLHTDLLDAFCPFDGRWREAVLESALRITNQAIEGMGRW